MMVTRKSLETAPLKITRDLARRLHVALWEREPTAAEADLLAEEIDRFYVSDADEREFDEPVSIEAGTTVALLMDLMMSDGGGPVRAEFGEDDVTLGQWREDRWTRRCRQSERMQAARVRIA